MPRFGQLSAPARDSLPLLALGALVVGITVLVGKTAVSNHYVFVDEANAIFFGREIADDASLAWSGSVARGPERLTSLALALFATLTDSASKQLWLLHAFMAVCQGLVAVPAWLAGRQLGLGRWSALVAAALAAAGSFAVYGIFTLNQSVGLLCATTMLWAMVRAIARPGLASDLAVVASLGATMLARLGWAPLVAALVPGALAASWLERPDGERFGAWLRALPARLVPRHPVLLPLLVLGVLAAIVLGPSSLLGGGYGGVRLEPDIQLSVLWDNSRAVFSHLALGLALVPFILALPLLARDLVRPADAPAGGYAWLVLALVAVFSYAYYGSIGEDRYFAVLVPPFALAGTLAIFRRPPPVWAVLLSGLLCARLVATSYRWPGEGPIDFFLAPSSLFFQRVVVGELTLRLPFSTPHVATVALLVALAAALVIAVVARVPRARRPLGYAAAGVALAGVLAFQLLAAEYPARKFLQTAGMPDVPADDLSFVDRAVGAGHAEPLAVDDAVHPDLEAQLPFLRVYNRTLGTGMAVMRTPGQPGAPVPRQPTVRVDWRTGATEVEGTEPNVLLQLAGFSAVGFAGEPLPPSAYYSFAQLTRLRHPLTPLWLIRGDAFQGFPEGGEPLRLRVFPPGAGVSCVRGAVAVPALADRSSRYRVTGGLRAQRGVAAYGAPGKLDARVRGGRPTTLTLRGSPVKLPDGSRLGPTFTGITVGACG